MLRNGIQTTKRHMYLASETNEGEEDFLAKNFTSPNPLNCQQQWVI